MSRRRREAPPRLVLPDGQVRPLRRTQGWFERLLGRTAAIVVRATGPGDEGDVRYVLADGALYADHWPRWPLAVHAIVRYAAAGRLGRDVPVDVNGSVMAAGGAALRAYATELYLSDRLGDWIDELRPQFVEFVDRPWAGVDYTAWFRGGGVGTGGPLRADLATLREWMRRRLPRVRAVYRRDGDPRRWSVAPSASGWRVLGSVDTTTGAATRAA